MKSPLDPKSISLFQAEGVLNQEIQNALEKFRGTLLSQLEQHSIAASKQAEALLHLQQDPVEKEGPEKTFKFRESLITSLFRISHFKTIYNMMIASFGVLTFVLVYDNLIKSGKFIDIATLTHFFRGVSHAITHCILLSIWYFTIIGILKIALKSSKLFWVPLYIIHLFGYLYIAFSATHNNSELGFATVIIVMAEGIRLLMKGHSYFRTKMLYLTENKYKQYQIKGIKVVIKAKTNDCDNEKQKQLYIKLNFGNFFQEFKRLAYFFIVPTMIYRDEYTLTPQRSLKKILLHFFNFLSCTYYSFIMYVMLCKENIELLDQNCNLNTVFRTFIKLMLPSSFFLVLGFFGFLHSWLNMWSQIARFPDRLFYSDWWNSIQFGSYYRKWNTVVHDWLYYYLYIDLCRFIPICRRSRNLARIMTFLISALIHELIVSCALGFFYPILFIMFTGPGILLVQNKRKPIFVLTNTLFWLQIYIGISILFTLYLIQVFARKSISYQFMTQQWGSLQFLIPRTFYLSSNSL